MREPRRQRKPQDDLEEEFRELKRLRAEVAKAEAAQRSDDRVKETNRDNGSAGDP
jgi:hypothetical protein